jgi:hypothetical protein
MKWEGHRQSDRVEDLRGGGGGGPRVGGRGVGIGGIVLALLAAWLFGINPMTVLGLMGDAPRSAQSQAEAGKPLQAQSQDEAFVATVLADTEDVWQAYFAQRQQTLEAPRMAVFREPVATACGRGESAMGPFTAPETSGSTWIWASSTSWRNSSERRAISPRPTSSPTRSGTTCSTSWVSAARCSRPGSASQRPRATNSACGWSCRPIALPASGRTTRSAARAGWSRATSRRP